MRPQKPGRRCGQNMQPRRNGGRLKKEKEKENLQQHRPKKRQNVPKETTEMRTKDYVPSEEPSSEDPPYEPTKKELKRADKEGDQ